MVYLTRLSRAVIKAPNYKSVDSELGRIWPAEGEASFHILFNSTRLIPVYTSEVLQREQKIPLQGPETFMASEVNSEFERLRA
jgi:hypothetical protein